MSKDNKASPNVSTEVLMLLCMIGAMERNDVATADVLGDFLQPYYYIVYIHINGRENDKSTVRGSYGLLQGLHISVYPQ